MARFTSPSCHPSGCGACAGSSPTTGASKSDLDGVDFCDGHWVHATPLSERFGRRRLPRPGEWLRAALARPEVEVLAYPEGRPLTRPEGLAPAWRLACAAQGRLGLPFSSRPGPCRGGGDRKGV